MKSALHLEVFTDVNHTAQTDRQHQETTPSAVMEPVMEAEVPRLTFQSVDENQQEIFAVEKLVKSAHFHTESAFRLVLRQHLITVNCAPLTTVIIVINKHLEAFSWHH